MPLGNASTVRGQSGPGLGGRRHSARHPDFDRKSDQNVEWPKAALSVCAAKPSRRGGRESLRDEGREAEIPPA